MKNKILKTLFFLSLSFLMPSVSFALVISHSGSEVDIEYSLDFRTHEKKQLSLKQINQLAEWHAGHLFGLFQAPQYAEQYGMELDLIEGYGGSKHPQIVQASGLFKDGDQQLWISYKASVRVLIQDPVIQGWLGNKKQGTVELPLPVDMTLIYSEDFESYTQKKWKKCTDSHYNLPVDFSYFYNPFICTELGEAPVGQMVPFYVRRVDNSAAKNIKIPKEEILSENKNGRLVTLYFINGFNEMPGPGSLVKDIKKDDGWKIYEFLQKTFVNEYGFEQITSLNDLKSKLGDDLKHIDVLSPVSLHHDVQRRYFSTFIKKTADVTYVVRSGLFNTENAVTSEPLVSFPQFWKEAWENGDFIYYGGHSGDGVSLSLETMLKTLSANDINNIRFSKNKMQIAFIDACSSYAHYMDMYAQKKPQKLHLMSYGLVSLYHLAPPTLATMLGVLLNEDIKTPTWKNTLAAIEKNQLEPHMTFLWGDEEGKKIAKKLAKKNQFPTMLINVWFPDNVEK